MGAEIEKEAGSCILKKYGNFFKTLHQDLLSLSQNARWDDNKSFFPVKVCLNSAENISITGLVNSDNTLMTKVLGVLSSLCIEVTELRKEAFECYFPFLAIYEEYDQSDITSHIKTVCSVNSFYMRCDDTLRNICSQMFAIFMEGLVNLNGIQMHYVINHIGELFTIIVLLELLISNTSLSKKWSNYCKSLALLVQSPEKLGLNHENVKGVLGATESITSKLMNDDITQNSLQNLLTLRKSLVDKNCSNVSAEFTSYLKQAITNLDKLVQEKLNINNAYKCVKINCLFVLTSHLFGTNDKKTFKSLIELNSKVHSVHIIGTTVWFPEQFLQRHIPALFASYGKISQTMLKARQSYVISKKASLAKDIAHMQSMCTLWTLTAEEIFSKNHDKLNATEMSQHAKVLFDGLDLLSYINHSIHTLINLHLSLGMPLPKSILMMIFEIIDLIKSLQNIISRNHYQVNNSINMIVQHLVFQAISSVQEVKKTLMTDKNYENKRLDELTCIVIAEQALKGATTNERNIAANVALSFVPDSTYLEDSYTRLCVLLEKVQILMNFTKSFEGFCNCSWIIWHQNIIPIYFEQNFNIQLNAVRIKYFLMVLEDCCTLLHKEDVLHDMAKHQEFICSMRTLINEKIMGSTSQYVETNLRLHIHSHLQLDMVNPFVNDMTKKLLPSIDMLRLQNVYMCVVPTVEHYLSTMYYNLTTVVLSDWKTYGEMRQMAKFKFNLNTVQDNLPTQTLEQGLDVLEIMRNIHVFVSKYHYNLNNQIFIEKSSNNKHLNSINIRHVANSIRTHGTGIMNTTVNFTYQFLKKKFFTFSQFMYDEHIKSRLIKDLRLLKEVSSHSGTMYPYKNAEKFNKGIRILGTGEDGQSYLDLFRDLISQIGNAMGYVRMIRSGGRHCCSDATLFLQLDNSSSIQEMCKESDLGVKCENAAEILDNTINNLVTNFLQGTEYFKLLVDVFAPVFRNPKNIHLKNFFIIIPPLTLNFIEHLILSKDKMTKKNKVGAAFTDDGFAMGVAYILKLLDQDSDFESLHWFDSVWKHILAERTLLEEQKIKGSIQLQQALALTEKKLKIIEEEYKMLYYSFTSARIFFR